MANKKISQLPVASTPSGTELVEIVQLGVNKQTTLDQIGGSGGLKWGGLWTFASNGGAFPAATLAGTLYISTDDHGSIGDADYAPANTWFVSKIDGADVYSEYSVNI